MNVYESVLNLENIVSLLGLLFALILVSGTLTTIYAISRMGDE